MNILVYYRGLGPRAGWQNMIEAQIRKLHRLAAIASARITLERERHGKGVFRLFAILEVPGPDFHAEATDYTVHAALMKVINNIRRQIKSRKDRQLERRKDHSQGGHFEPRAFLS